MHNNPHDKINVVMYTAHGPFILECLKFQIDKILRQKLMDTRLYIDVH